MGSTLYNKIHLGRSPLFGSRGARLALLISIAAGAGLAWTILRTMR